MRRGIYERVLTDKQRDNGYFTDSQLRIFDQSIQSHNFFK